MNAPRPCVTKLTLLSVIFVLLSASLQVQGKSRADCEQVYKPYSGQSGKDVIWVPTADALVERMLQMAEVSRKDLVYDLGSGDGKIPIMAAKKFGASAVGVEYNPDMVRLAQCLVEAEGVTDRVRILQGDIFATDFRDATVVTLYLQSDLNLRLRPALLDLKPGTRVVSHSFTMGEWEPDQESSTSDGLAFLWVVPAKVGGQWVFKSEQGKDQFTVNFEQEFQRLRGTAGPRAGEITDGRLIGSHIEFGFNDSGARARVTGDVSGARIEAKLTRGGRTSKYTATRAQMPASLS